MVQLIGYGFAGLLRTLLVWPTYALYPNQLPSISLLQSMHFGGLLNRKKMKYFWIGNFFWSPSTVRMLKNSLLSILGYLLLGECDNVCVHLRLTLLL
jgi:hypothetical protein